LAGAAPPVLTPYGERTYVDSDARILFVKTTDQKPDYNYAYKCSHVTPH